MFIASIGAIFRSIANPFVAWQAGLVVAQKAFAGGLKFNEIENFRSFESFVFFGFVEVRVDFFGEFVKSPK